MQCENISYRFGIYFCEIFKEEKSIDCHGCPKFVQAYLWSRYKDISHEVRI